MTGKIPKIMFKLALALALVAQAGFDYVQFQSNRRPYEKNERQEAVSVRLQEDRDNIALLKQINDQTQQSIENLSSGMINLTSGMNNQTKVIEILGKKTFNVSPPLPCKGCVQDQYIFDTQEEASAAAGQSVDRRR